MKKEWNILRKYLNKLDVSILKSVFVKDYDGKTLTLSNGDIIKTANVIWSAGVKGNIINGLNNNTLINNRYKVDRINKILGYNNLFALGDVAYMATTKYPNGHPQVANVAINQGKLLAKNLINIVNNKSTTEYEYSDKGSMATIGKHMAVVDLPFVKFKGYWAWFVWMFLHLMLILSVRNKLIIFINWAINYFTTNSSLRLIVKPENPHKTE